MHVCVDVFDRRRRPPDEDGDGGRLEIDAAGDGQLFVCSEFVQCFGVCVCFSGLFVGWLFFNVCLVCWCLPDACTGAYAANGVRCGCDGLVSVQCNDDDVLFGFREVMQAIHCLGRWMMDDFVSVRFGNMRFDRL